MTPEIVNRRKPFCKTQTGQQAKLLKYMAGAAGLEPATCGFGVIRFFRDFNDLPVASGEIYREHGENMQGIL